MKELNHLHHKSRFICGGLPTGKVSGDGTEFNFCGFESSSTPTREADRRCGMNSGCMKKSGMLTVFMHRPTQHQWMAEVRKGLIG